jgi:hypothetical protein
MDEFDFEQRAWDEGYQRQPGDTDQGTAATLRGQALRDNPFTSVPQYLAWLESPEHLAQFGPLNPGQQAEVRQVRADPDKYEINPTGDGVASKQWSDKRILLTALGAVALAATGATALSGGFAGVGGAGVGGAGGASGASTAAGAVPSYYTAGLAPVASGLTAPTLASTAASTAGWSIPGVAKQAWDGLSSDGMEVAGNVVDWTTGYIGDRRAEGVRADDKVAADARYQAALDLLATQRTEDLQLDADRETALQARWQAQQDQRQTMWDAQETRLEPYRQAGQQSLARVANVQPPTRTPYRSRFMG